MKQPLSEHQKDLFTQLLQPGYYVMCQPMNNGLRVVLYKDNMRPIRRYYESAMNSNGFRVLLKRDGRGRYTLNKKFIRSMDGRTFQKRTYKKQKNQDAID